jgi:AcrR family transcriptional regulator
MDKTLGREDWLRAARLALLHGGVEAVRVEKLARTLEVTKGSFYWHFKDREELLELLLCEWESELEELVGQVGTAGGVKDLRSLLSVLVERARLSEQGQVPSDAAIFAWASVSPEVAQRVNRAEQERLDLLKQWSGMPERVELLYLAWLGFVARGQRVPALRRRFPEIAQAMLELVQEPGTAGGRRRRKARGEKPA